ncbi:MAG: DUF2141 domain-containing protein [Bacteroidales bacterium]|nr:DUF2141 domain-containing protein [Bacteroidales bacterium]
MNYVLFFALFCSFITVKAQNIHVVISNIRSSQGRMVIGVFKDEQGFKEDKPVERKKFEKASVINGKMIVKFSLEPGTYGFALLDDENDDDKMNFNFIGIPQEGFGFSNYYHSSLTRPKFDTFKFVLNGGETQKILIKVKYI